jgi:hypothetical protein
MDKNKYQVENLKIYIKDRNAAKIAVDMGAAQVDHQGAFTTTTMWLSGDNPWGFHNDVRFSAPMSAVRQRQRIVKAAEKANNAILLIGDDLAIIQEIMVKPLRHESVPNPYPALMAEVLPIWEVIETADIWEEGA